MKSIDVFNGDADGICALHQLRLADPKDSTLITGVKRDIALVKQVQAEADDSVTILDISLDKNRDDGVNVVSQDLLAEFVQFTIRHVGRYFDCDRHVFAVFCG